MKCIAHIISANLILLCELMKMMSVNGCYLLELNGVSVWRLLCLENSFELYFTLLPLGYIAFLNLLKK